MLSNDVCSSQDDDDDEVPGVWRLITYVLFALLQMDPLAAQLHS